MADQDLLLFRSLCERASEGRMVKERVITKAPSAPRPVEQFAFYCPLKGFDELAILRQRYQAHEPRATIGDAAHLLEQQSIVCPIVAVRSSETRRVNAGRTVQCIHG